jgi:hypothetical protein
MMQPAQHVEENKRQPEEHRDQLETGILEKMFELLHRVLDAISPRRFLVASSPGRSV